MNKICPVCNIVFEVAPSQADKRTTCSYACRAKLYSQRYSGEGNHNWKGGKQKSNCLLCGKEFYAYPRLKQEYCSLNCAGLSQRKIIEDDKRTYNIKYYQERREAMQAKSKATRERLKLIVLTHYGNGKCACVSCGEQRLPCLSLDHIDGNGAEHKRAMHKYTLHYQWFIANSFPIGYQTLCMNCQWVKRYENHEYTSKVPRNGCQNLRITKHDLDILIQRPHSSPEILRLLGYSKGAYIRRTWLFLQGAIEPIPNTRDPILWTINKSNPIVSKVLSL